MSAFTNGAGPRNTFKTEAGLIAKAKTVGWPLSAEVGVGGDIERIESLSLSWLNNEIDPATRTFKFYVIVLVIEGSPLITTFGDLDELV